MAETIDTDVLVVGAGAAGMRAAYEANLGGAKVLLVVKGRFGAIGVRGAGASAAGVSEFGLIGPAGWSPRMRGERAEPDSVLRDILQCGLGMADPTLARVLVDEAFESRRHLEEWGMIPTFTEGYGIRTHGVPIQMALEDRIHRSNISVLDRTTVIDVLLKDGFCAGALAVDERLGNVLAINARSTILATGGLGRLYPLNFHPACITGDGYALGYEAGAELFNMEFHQMFIGTIFPTNNLVHSWMRESYPRLTNAQGEEFLSRYLPEGATIKECYDQRNLHSAFTTRDPLSRYMDLAIYGEVEEGRGTPRGGVFVELADPQLKPEILEWYRYRGIHWDRGPVEIGSCHHCCHGGLRINRDAETTVPGLFAAGEVAAGPHGADRMAGMMLLASQVFGARAGRQAAKQARDSKPVGANLGQVLCSEKELKWPRRGDLTVAQVTHSLGTLVKRNLMVARTDRGLNEVLTEVTRIRMEDLPRVDIRDPLDLVHAVEVRNSLRSAEIVARACLERKESRGGHFREDFPKTDDENWRKVVTVKKVDSRMTAGTLVLDPNWEDRTSDMAGLKWG